MFLVWSPSDVLAAYTRQGGRSITAESVWFLPLHALGLAHVHGHVSSEAGAPGWTKAAAIGIKIALVLVVIVGAARAASRTSAVALAALAPVVFLLSNVVFSPQFLVTAVAAWALAAALVVRSPQEQLAVGLAALGAVTAGVFVYPYALPAYATTWQIASATSFALGIGLTTWLAAQARSRTEKLGGSLSASST